jgi:hypothetical protein
MKNSGSGKAETIEDVILGEAIGVGRGNVLGTYEDMLAIASVIANRAEQLGVKPEDVLTEKQFNAYGKALPAGSQKNAWMARQAWEQVVTKGPVHNATFYATPAATKNLPSGLTQVGSTRGHQYFTDPKNRSIETKNGFRTPGSVAVASLPDRVPVPTPAPRGGITGNQMTLASFAPDRSPAANRGLQAINAAMNLPSEEEIESDLPPDNYLPDATDMNPIYTLDKGASKLSIDRNANANIGNTVYSFERAMSLFEAATGRRAPAVNDAIAKAGTSREKQTRGSQHFAGRALDISVKGLSDKEKQALVSSLQAAGFTSFGLGSNILHADTRAARNVWDYGLAGGKFAGISLEKWAESLTQGKLPQQVIDTVNSMGNSRIPVPLPAPTRTPPAAPVPTPAPSRVSPSAVQFGPGPSSRTPPAAPQPVRSVPDSAVQFGPGPASRTPPGFVPMGAVQFGPGPGSRNRTPLSNPATVQRMQDNLRNQMAFMSPNPSNMNVSGYGFSTPAKAASPQAAGSATGSVAQSPRADIGGSVAVPSRSPFGGFSLSNVTNFAPGPTTSNVNRPSVSMDSVARQAQNATRQSQQTETWKDVTAKPQERLQEAARPMAPPGTPGNMGAAGYGLSRPAPAPAAGMQSRVVTDPRVGLAPQRNTFNNQLTPAVPAVAPPAAPAPMSYGTPAANKMASAYAGYAAARGAPLGGLSAAPAPQRQAPPQAPAPQRQITNEPQFSGRTPGDRARSASFQPGGIFGYTSQMARGGGGYNPTPV